MQYVLPYYWGEVLATGRVRMQDIRPRTPVPIADICPLYT